MTTNAWQMLAYAQTLRGSTDESAGRRRMELDPGDADYAVEWMAERRLRQGDFAAADALLRGRIETAPPGREERSMGWLVTSLRMQERWSEAFAVARRFRALGAVPGGPGVHPIAVNEAQVLFESGRGRDAAALYDSISRWSSSGAGNSNRIWQLTHMADALVAAGDTAGLPVLVDTIRALAPLSGYGRDARLPYHVEGLLLAARGQDVAAVDAFRRAIFSWNMGYTRTNLEMARALLRLGRAREAVAALQPALRGSLEVNNSYVTHTELRRVLAEAWRTAGNADSATAHERWVRAATGR
jgi:tetratricopeptide (TPR) repeat protein